MKRLYACGGCGSVYFLERADAASPLACGSKIRTANRSGWITTDCAGHLRRVSFWSLLLQFFK